MTKETLLALYELETAEERLALLGQQAGDADAEFLTQCIRRRHYTINPSGSTDVFMRAWMNLHTDAQTEGSLFGHRRRQKALEEAMKDFGLTAYPGETPRHQELMQAEWTDFAEALLKVTVGSRAYCSTLFGMVQMSDTKIAERLAQEIWQVTRAYPQKCGVREAFEPLHECVISVVSKKLKGASACFDRLRG